MLTTDGGKHVERKEGGRCVSRDMRSHLNYSIIIVEDAVWKRGPQISSTLCSA